MNRCQTCNVIAPDVILTTRGTLCGACSFRAIEAELKTLRKIAAHVPGNVWIAAKEAAGVPTGIVLVDVGPGNDPMRGALALLLSRFSNGIPCGCSEMNANAPCPACRFAVHEARLALRPFICATCHATLVEHRWDAGVCGKPECTIGRTI